MIIDQADHGKESERWRQVIAEAGIKPE